MAAQRLEEGLKAAVDGAAQYAALDLDLAHPKCTLDLVHRGGSDERDLDSLQRMLVCHGFEPRSRQIDGNPWNYRILVRPVRTRPA